MSQPTTASYGKVPPGYRCGRCDKPLHTSWDSSCKRCGARYIDFPPAATNAPDPTGDSPALKRFRALMFGATVAVIVGALVLMMGGGVAIFVPLLFFGFALGLIRYKRTRW